MPTAPKPSVLIATPAYNGVSVAHAKMILEICTALSARGHRSAWMTLEKQSFLIGARNQLSASFMASDFDACFMIDSDMSIPAEAFIRMLDTGVEYITAAAACRTGYVGERPNLSVEVDISQPIVNGILDSPCAGVACTILRRSVFEKLNAAGATAYVLKLPAVTLPIRDYFSPLVVGDTLFSEDYSFSRRCRMAGITMRVLPDADVEHAGVRLNLARCIEAGTVGPSATT